MNYYERFVGDFQRDTGHLSCTEIGVYDRFLDHYYALEQPLPADYSDLCRIARAMDKTEQKAVKRVADEFFPIGDDGLRHNPRADREISKAQNRIGTARENGKKGGRPPKAKPEHNRIATQEKPSGFSSANPPETQPGVHHAPHANKNPSEYTTALASDSGSTSAGAVCARLKSECGMLDVSPQHPKLIAILAAGVTADEIIDAGRDAKIRGKGFAYTLAVAEGRRRDAAGVKPIAPKSTPGQKTADAVARWLESEGAQP